MKYSYVMIAYNEDRVIKQSIQSILDQKNVDDFELIVINDRSTDDTSQVVREFIKSHPHIHLFENEKNMGRGYSRNRGVSLAKGDYIAFIDADLILPPNWTSECTLKMEKYDAVGGIAVPDGDVCYISNIFKLKPKKVVHTTSISGNNGLFKSKVLKKINYDATLRDGEDVDLLWRITHSGYKTHSLVNLICTHNEQKSFWQSLRWLFEQGVGANKLLNMYKKWRLPDISFILLVILSLISIWQFKNNSVVILLPFLFIFFVSGIHLFRKFHFSFKNVKNYLLASLVNFLMLLSYFGGRIYGLYIFFNPMINYETNHE